MKQANREQVVAWSAFVRAALALGLVGGFGLGGALFAAVALGQPLGAWWVAAAQAHGQVQLLGWAGLTVVGVALHFLPRLRGATPAQPVAARSALVLLVAGLGLRLIGQPLLALPLADWLQLAVRLGLAGAGLCGVLGATLAVGGLARALAGGPPLRQREGFRQVAPFLIVAFGCYWIANALTGAGLAALAWQGIALLDGRLDQAIILVACYGFLWPICIAMSARLFPLHFRTALAHHPLLRTSLACAAGGMALRVWGLGGASAGDRAGQLLLAVSLVLMIAGVGIFAPRRPLPRGAPPIHTDPHQLAALSACGWLAVTAGVLALNGLAALGVPVPAPAGEIHLFGAGFVTILILGVGTVLLPGFSRRPLRSRKLLWLTLVAANCAVLARIIPLWLAPLLPFLPSRTASLVLASAGLCGLLALLAFGINLSGAHQPTRRTPATAR